MAWRQSNAKKQQKKLDKIKSYQMLLAALNDASSRRGGQGGVCGLVCWLVLLCLCACLGLAYMAATDTACSKLIQPLVVELQKKGSDFDMKANEQAIVHAVSCISSAGAEAACACCTLGGTLAAGHGACRCCMC